MKISTLNQLTELDAQGVFLQCCAASRWANDMSLSRPFNTVTHVLDCSESIWETMITEDFLQAFDGHPKIGDPDSLKKKYRNTHALASNEQSAVDQTSDQVLEELMAYNKMYEEKFGYIFIVCATGKSAEEMLGLVKQRINHNPDYEIELAAAEQAKITAIRINSLFELD